MTSSHKAAWSNAAVAQGLEQQLDTLQVAGSIPVRLQEGGGPLIARVLQKAAWSCKAVGRACGPDQSGPMHCLVTPFSYHYPCYPGRPPSLPSLGVGQRLSVVHRLNG